MKKTSLILSLLLMLFAGGCSNEQKLLQECYEYSEDTIRESVKSSKPEDWRKLASLRKRLGVDSEILITQAGRDRCKRLVELGKFPSK